MKILAFAASNSLVSINNQLIQYAVNELQQLLPSAEIEIIHLSDYEIPFYRPDREQESGVPEQAKVFYEKIGAADALLISFAEHNGSYAAVYKNLFDWTSRIDVKVFQLKPTVLLSSSPGRGGAGNVLKQAINSAPHFGMEILATASLPSFNHSFDKDKVVVTDTEHKQDIDNALKTFTTI